MLQDEREQYKTAGPVKDTSEASSMEEHLTNLGLSADDMETLKTKPVDSPEVREIIEVQIEGSMGMSPEHTLDVINGIAGRNIQKAKGGKVQFAAGGSLLADDMIVEEDLPIEETHTMPDGTEMPGATHEGYEEDMSPEEQLAPEEQLVPDGEMEKEFLDFILDKALSPEEEEILMSKLEQDEELSMLFDRVVDVAQEFAGAGPVEGPGSGVSDSIPARLSDGEFVFTAEAVEVIGADNLMAMMKDAESQAGDRQGLAEGGEPEERVVIPVQEQKEPQVRIVKETVDNGGKGLLDEDEVSKGVKSKMMLDPLQRHVRS